MIKTPLKKVTKSLKTPAIMWFLMCFVLTCELLILFPLYYDQLMLVYVQIGLYVSTMILHLWGACKDPGYIKSPKFVPFMDMLKIFDPEMLCSDCEIVRTDRSRHCSICNRCVERFDHHCPWINNCVGVGNHGVFLSFLLSMLALLGTNLISLILNFKCW